jgi:signal transduction histidine kinase
MPSHEAPARGCRNGDLAPGSLIQNVLNYARQQRDKLTITPRPLSLDDIATRAIEFWKPLLEAKGFEITSSHGRPCHSPGGC